MKIALPLANGLLAEHFGHCQEFAVVEIDPEAKKIKQIEKLSPPAHQPGILPPWLSQIGVKAVIAGGMGVRAIQMFSQMGIDVHAGAPVKSPEELVTAYLDGSLVTNYVPCDHSGGNDCHQHEE